MKCKLGKSRDTCDLKVNGNHCEICEHLDIPELKTTGEKVILRTSKQTKAYHEAYHALYNITRIEEKRDLVNLLSMSSTMRELYDNIHDYLRNASFFSDAMIEKLNSINATQRAT